jgi:hypothetical protein
VIFVFATAAILAGAFAAFAAIVFPIAATVENVRRARRGDKRHVSLVPLVGTIFGAFAVLLAPIGSMGDRAKWVWVPLLVEVVVYVACASIFAKMR